MLYNIVCHSMPTGSHATVRRIVNVFIYEYITGGGLLGSLDTAAINRSLLREGTAMVVALATDFAALDDVEVTVLVDRRLGPLPFSAGRHLSVGNCEEATAAFVEETEKADWTIVIAPETNGALIDCCRRVHEVGGRLLGPELDAVELASDKHATCERLKRAGMRVPLGLRLDANVRPPEDFDFPAVIKPLYGAGSDQVRYLVDSSAARRTTLPGVAQRIERYCPGMPVSVTLICGPAGRITLPACRQHLSDDGRFRYLGGSLPLPADLAARAQRLAESACDALDVSRGYVGVDLVLGPDSKGRDDYVIEINSRLTTSYVGLRAATQDNLALAMWRLAEGRETTLSFNGTEVQFDADGTVFTTNHVRGLA